MRKIFLIVFLVSLIFVFACSQDEEAVDVVDDIFDDSPDEVLDDFEDETDIIDDVPDETNEESGEDFFNYIESVNTEFSDGVLYYEILVAKPTPCHEIDLVEEYDDGVLTITLSFVSTDEICAQVITPENITGEFKAESEPDVLVFLD